MTTKTPPPNYRDPSLPALDVDGMADNPRSFEYFTDPDAFDEAKDPPRSLLEWRRCWGAAPYVGRAFVYIWDALVETDGTERAITGSARIHHLPFDPGNPATWDNPEVSR